MKNNIQNRLLVIATALFTFFTTHAQSNKTQSPNIYSASNPQELAQFTRLNLDESHPDLLDPSVARDDQENVKSSWIDLHKKMGAYLQENGFTWGEEIQNISIYHRIYFSANGKVTNYLFNIKDPKVTEEKKAEFGELLQQFTTKNKLAYQRSTSFAQCGKTRF